MRFGGTAFPWPRFAPETGHQSGSGSRGQHPNKVTVTSDMRTLSVQSCRLVKRDVSRPRSYLPLSVASGSPASQR